jgi:hypothetical protein
MRYSKLLQIISSAIFLGACATPAPKPYFAPASDQIPLQSIQIASVFETVSVNANNLGAEANRCVPQINGSSKSVLDLLQRFPNNNINTLGHVSTSKRFSVRNNVAYCLSRSVGNHPIFAAEAFFRTANPDGVPPDVTDVWYKKIAYSIAEKGSSKVAYKFSNGNAALVSYWTNPQNDSINYSYEFKRLGTWETDKYDNIFTNPSMSGVTTTKNNNQMTKSFPLSHRQ